ncbi:hypothetical protein DFH08DRAFT_974449 [Mycena albidolilacea]|uniref:Uncharacterized protein n=1 Tax=Mycena albidolilacea TaxID=1033008 RepID=A0AAD7ECC7_9AGAR|nr:hypothetical protein DFH08DRAFT_974449 [Mycena albidolilacea]
MPQQLNKSEAKFLNQLCAISAEDADNLSVEDTTARIVEKNWRKVEQKAREEAEQKAREEATRRAKEEWLVKAEADQKAEEEWKAEEKRKKKDPAKDKRKTMETDREEEEGNVCKKQKWGLCTKWASMLQECIVATMSTRSQVCVYCHKHKIKCSLTSADTNRATGEDLSAAIQELTELTEGGLVGSFTALQDIKGSLSNIIAPESARLRLEFGEAGVAEAGKILDAWRKRKVK